LDLTDPAILLCSPKFFLDQIGSSMIILGIILLVIGYFTSLSILYTIGAILIVVGAVLWILGAVGRPVGGRKVWF
jgi:vacuolar-type H+-ATPase subunit I/STV1